MNTQNTAGSRQAPHPQDTRFQAAIFILLLAGLWIAGRPYFGIIRDARLYVAQSLRRLGTNGFESDLFFLYGSQDNYSVFSTFFSPLVASVGPGPAHLIFYVLAHGFWFAALITLVLAVFGRKPLAFAAAATVIFLNSRYGWEGSIKYAEQYVTPRLFAEATVLLAFAAAWRSRKWAAIILVLLAVPLHPLMALPGIVMIFLFLFPLNVKTASLAFLAVTAISGLAFAGIDPFIRLTQTFDMEWMEIIEARQPHAFISQWGIQSVNYAVLPMTILLMTSLTGSGPIKRLSIIILTVASLMILASWVFGDLLGNVMILNLQTWRSLWLFTLFGNLLVIPTVFSLPKRSLTRRTLIITTVLGAISILTHTKFLTATLMSMLTLIIFLMEQRLFRTLPTRVHFAAKGIGYGFIGLKVLVVFAVLELVAAESGPYDFLLRWLVTLILCLLFLVHFRNSGINRWAVAVASVLAVAGSAAIWDSRDGWRQFLEAGPGNDPLLDRIVDKKNIYWEGGPELLWLKMQKPSFYSCAQGAGIMFYRGTAIEHRRRSLILRQLNTKDFYEEPTGHCYQKADPEAEGEASADVLASVCRDLPELDRLVLQSKIKASRTLDAPYEQWTWTPPVAERKFNYADLLAKDDEDAPEDFNFYAYDCSDFTERD